MGRRSNGEGAIVRRTDGRWAAAAQVNGKRHWVYGKTRKEASDKLQELQRAKADGNLVDPTRLTVGDFLGQWLQGAATTRKPSTVHTLESVIRVHLIPTIGDIRLQRLSPLTIGRMYRDKSESLSARRVNIIHEALRAALNDAVRWGLLAVNPAGTVKPPRQEPAEHKVWTPAQARAFIAAVRASDNPYAWALGLTLTLGLRESELAGLTWAAVDLDAAAVKIERGLVHVGGRPTWGDLKTAASRRTLALSPLARELLGKLRRWQAAARLRAGGDWRNAEGRVLCTATGGIPTPHRLLIVLRGLCADAGIPRQTVHGLRHMAATLLLASGADVKSVQGQLGHSRAAITLDVYSHALPGSGADLAERMQRVLSV